MEKTEGIDKQITIPDLFVKRISQHTKKEPIEEELKKFSRYHSLDYEFVFYTFVKKILKSDLFFKMNRDIANDILFQAVYWASGKETKKKIRPTSMQKVPKDKTKNFYTKLQKDTVLALCREFKDRPETLDIEMNDYLSMFFELSCIKRDRRKKNDV